MRAGVNIGVVVYASALMASNLSSAAATDMTAGAGANGNVNGACVHL